MWSCSRRVGGIWALAVALIAGGAHAAHAKPSAKGRTQSVGAPNNGHLAGAARLKGSRYLKQRDGAHSWGTPQLVHLLNGAARDVAKKHKGSQMLVGDLSGRTGGHLDGHGSHQTGRDADIGFYVMNRNGKPVSIKHFIAFDELGHGKELGWAYFDEARNWSMVESMLKSDKAAVHYIFVINGLRAKLLSYAAKKHVSKELLTRAAQVMMSPTDADLHDNHFHVRISCPESMREICVEESAARLKSAPADEGDKPSAPPPSAPPPSDPAAASDPAKGETAVAERSSTDKSSDHN